MALIIGRKVSFALTAGAIAAALLVPLEDVGAQTSEAENVAAALREQELRLAEQERRLNEQLRKLEAQQQALAQQQEQMNAMRQALTKALAQADAPAPTAAAAQRPAPQQPQAQQSAPPAAQVATGAAKAGDPETRGRMETAVLTVQQRRQHVLAQLRHQIEHAV